MPAADEESEEDRTLRAEATSLKHLMTHLPSNPYCRACQVAKMKRKHMRARDKLALKMRSDQPEVFGEKVSADHQIARSEVS